MSERTWPTDHLTDAERRLARLWNGIPDNHDALIDLTEDREAILFAVDDALGRARGAAAQLSPQPDPAPLDRLVQLVGWLTGDLRNGAAQPDVVGQGSYAAQIEEAIEATWAAWETAERQAGRAPLTHDEAVADIAERLSWDRY